MLEVEVLFENGERSDKGVEALFYVLGMDSLDKTSSVDKIV